MKQQTMVPRETLKLKMTRRRRLKHDSQQYTKRSLCIALTLLAKSVHSQFVPVGTETCPSNPELTGYTNLANLQTDIDTEFDRIVAGGTPEDSYVLLLCPQTTFDTSGDDLEPKLNNCVFSCGATGDVTENCVFSGGNQNIRVRDPATDGYVFETMTFQGITFTQFNSRSINLSGQAPTEAIFQSCVWEVCFLQLSIQVGKISALFCFQI